MPTYEYRCNACSRSFEYVQKMSDDDLVVCEACGEPRLEKLISRSAFQLKGSGWYKDLYASNPKEAIRDGMDKVPPPKSDKEAPTPATYGDGSVKARTADSGGTSSSGTSSGGSSSGGSSSGGSSSGGSSSNSGGGESSGGSSGKSSTSDS